MLKYDLVNTRFAGKPYAQRKREPCSLVENKGPTDQKEETHEEV